MVGDTTSSPNGLIKVTLVAELLPRTNSGAARLTRARFVWSSSLADAGESNELLVALTKQAGGDTYLCGDGAAEYFDASRFEAEGLSVEYQRFVHPQYPQRGAPEFVSGLSVIDALMHCGAAGVSRLLQ